MFRELSIGTPRYLYCLVTEILDLFARISKSLMFCMTVVANSRASVLPCFRFIRSSVSLNHLEIEFKSADNKFKVSFALLAIM